MADNSASTKFFEAMNDGFDAFIDAVRATNDRGHRVSAALIENAQQGQREAVGLAKQWAQAPLDVAGLSSSVVDVTTKAQSRSLDATRQWFGELAGAQEESRQLIQRVIQSNRAAGEAAAEMARGWFSRAGEAVQSLSKVNGAMVPADVRKTRSTESSSV
ncbi:MAG: hypothetical protein WBD55_09995 [Dehalococcoidia bacterium]